jgi:hypothetical protein
MSEPSPRNLYTVVSWLVTTNSVCDIAMGEFNLATRSRWGGPKVAHICTGTGLTPATSAPGVGPPRPHLHRDWAHPGHICTFFIRSAPTVLFYQCVPHVVDQWCVCV